ncbi:MAG: UDP-N-acetylmuramate dehydrogenase [Oscillospiraceae bacterium]|nr:UDP-N-acetylmuramate dehydrogenase [Oscillospiraceae bacterium]
MDIYFSAEKFILENFPDSVILKDEPLKKHTSFKIGGCVPMLVIPESATAVGEIYRFFKTNGITPLVIGNGTNILAEDCELPFPVIKTHGKAEGVRLISDTEIEADCGITLAQLAVFAQKNGLTGLEFAHGIPGSLGGAVYMNAGAYGGEMAHVVTKTTALGSEGIYEVCGDEHDFSYRHSVFSDRNDIILSTVIKLEHGDKAEISAKMEELASKRRASQPLNMPSAGSTFKRPANGYAAAMIDQCGLKGYTVGGAQVSEKHAGFVVNCGDATFDNVMGVIHHVRETVKAKFDTYLETEVKIIDRNYRG